MVTAFRAQLVELESEYDNMLSCIRCGLCLTSCPTYVLSLHESEGPRGRVGMARAFAEGHLDITPDLVEHEMNCLVCDACSAVCPAGVHMDPLQVGLRSALESAQQRGRTFSARVLRAVVFGWLFTDMRHFRTLGRLVWAYQRFGLRWLARRLGVLRLLRLDEVERLLPDVPTRFHVSRGDIYPPPRSSGQSPPTPSEVTLRVAFFAGCVMSTALANVDRATLRVLQSAGCEVHDPEAQGCCGALNAHGGDLPRALDMARANIAAFENTTGPIVVNSAGCGAMLKDYAHHLRGDPTWAERASAFSARVRDLSQVLAPRSLPLKAVGEPRKIVYQDACHLLHAQGVRQQPRDLLQRIVGVELAEIAEPGLCCGSAGIYNVTNPKESAQLQQRKVANILACAPDLIVTANPGCLLQVQAGLRARSSTTRVAHLAEVLDEATAR